jgi:hydrogenase expression/formation protein HypE
MVPVTLIANEVVCPGATVLDPGFTKRFHAYAEGILALIRSIENMTKTVRTGRTFFKTNHTEMALQANMVNSTTWKMNVSCPSAGQLERDHQTSTNPLVSTNETLLSRPHSLKLQRPCTIERDMRHFKTGKIPSDVLVRNVFRYKGSKDASVLLGSSIGEDAALVSLDNKVLVLKTDPVTGATSDMGSLAVHINANDVACRGARPRWFLCDLLLPENSKPSLIDKIMRQVDRAAKQIGVSVVGGHTEVTPGLTKPILVGYMVGVVERGKFVTSNGARIGDHIIMTKTAGLEGTAVLASDFPHKIRKEADANLVSRARALRHRLSVVGDALIAVRAGGVRALHDPTEGGLLQGVWELAEASKVGFLIHESMIPILPETKRICSIFRVSPLRLMSSGCLLIAGDKRKSSIIVRRLWRNNIPAQIIGRFVPRRKGRILVRLDGTAVRIGPQERDELYRILERHRSS